VLAGWYSRQPIRRATRLVPSVPVTPTSGMRPLSPVREQVLDDGLADFARLAGGRLDVGQQARAGIDFDDGAALLFERARDVFAHQVDAGDVQADHARGQRRHVRHVRVDLVGDVVGDVAVRLDQHFLAGLRHRGRGQALALQVEQDLVVVRVDGPSGCSSLSPRRGSVLIWLSHSSTRSTCRRRSPTAIRPWRRPPPSSRPPAGGARCPDEALDQHGAAVAGFGGDRVGGLHVRFGHQVQRHAAAVVAVDRLDTTGRPMSWLLPRRRRRCAPRRLPAPARRTEASRVLVRSLSLAMLFADGAGAVGFGGPDAALGGAVAELHQVAFGQADRRDAALGGGVDDVRGGRAEAVAVDQFGQRATVAFMSKGCR
jgi:hypothetical protein